LSFHEQVRQGFLALARQNPTRIVTIDANQEADFVFSKARQKVEELIAKVKSR
jgi:dTMP kinase